ncbi:Fic family protein [Rugamonas sp. CCM 8940]|uniref:Fic family protein n=1 Tax=Rugamonas sp. CCM 8940 TaxID=2765359 RepID=UPI0018F64F86|nr:RNA-binding domain-containing protein [Rugamonas sp. CCM 8940]MBJ7311584.1 putative DNA binding domain-containing protein [Rugamonas sp. CCM 8940]
MSDKLPINALELLRQRTVESERIEYKAGWNPDTTMRTLCAFANDFENLGGGYVVIGQHSDGDGKPIFPPVGVAENQLDKIQRELLACCQLIQPPYFPVLSVELVDGHYVILLWAPGGQNRPYKVPASVTARHKSWHYYIRRYSSTVEAKGEIEQELLSLTAKIPFDDRFAQVAQVGDLSCTLMREFLLEVGSALAEDVSASLESLGRQMNVVGGPFELAWPKNVGLLFFNDAPQRFFPGTQIDVLWFPDGPGGDRFVEKIFHGPLGRMTREALDYIQRNFLQETVIKHPQRAEAQRLWNFPFTAIEEAVVNAVYHRSYEEREPIEVRISRDELVVLSFPGPDRSIRLEDLQAGRAVSRRYRNRRIGEFLKELDLTEGRATGIPKILKVMAANGSPAPLFETDDDRTSFVIRLPRHHLAQARVMETMDVTMDVGRATMDVTMDVGRDTMDVTMDVPVRVAALLQVVKGEMSRAMLQQAMGLGNADHLRKAYLVPAMAAGFLDMTVPATPRSRQQRYRLTEKGKIWMLAHLQR